MIKKGVDPLENAIVEGSALKMEQTMDDLVDGGKVQPRTARFLRYEPVAGRHVACQL